MADEPDEVLVARDDPHLRARGPVHRVRLAETAEVRVRVGDDVRGEEILGVRRRGGRGARHGLMLLRYISRRPASARPRVTSSAYSRSPPTGSPLARRVTRVFPRRRSARYDAVASPVMFGFVASTTSSTPFISTRRRSESMRRSLGSTPSSGESAPPSTW